MFDAIPKKTYSDLDKTLKQHLLKVMVGSKQNASYIPLEVQKTGYWEKEGNP